MKKQTKKCRTQKRKRGGKRKTLKKGGRDNRNASIATSIDQFALGDTSSLAKATRSKMGITSGKDQFERSADKPRPLKGTTEDTTGKLDEGSTVENEGDNTNNEKMNKLLNRKKRIENKIEAKRSLTISDNIAEVRKAKTDLDGFNQQIKKISSELKKLGKDNASEELENNYRDTVGILGDRLIKLKSIEKEMKERKKAFAQAAATEARRRADVKAREQFDVKNKEVMKELKEKAEGEARKNAAAEKAEEDTRKKATEDGTDQVAPIAIPVATPVATDVTAVTGTETSKRPRFMDLLNESMKDELQQPNPEVKKNNQRNLLNIVGKAAAATAAAVGKAAKAIIPTNNKETTENRVVIRNPKPDVDTPPRFVLSEDAQQFIKQNPDNQLRYDATPTDAQPLVRYEEPQPPIPLNKNEEVEVESNAIVNLDVATDPEPVAETTDEEQSYTLALINNPVKNMQQIASQISDALVVVPNKPDAPKPKQTTPPARFYKSMRPATETLIRKNLDNGLIAMMEYMEHTPTRGDYSDSAYARFEKKTAKGKDTWDIDIRQTPNGYKYITVDSSGNDSEAYRTGDGADRKIRVAVRNEIMKRLKDGYVPANTTRKLKDKSNNKGIAETRRLYRNRKGVYESSYKPTSTKQTTASRRTRKLRSNRIARKHIADSAKIDEKREKLAAERANKKKEAERAANNTDANQ